MNDLRNYSRNRTMSGASTGSFYGEEFIGLYRKDRTIDEVCRKMSEATVDVKDTELSREERLSQVDAFIASNPRPQPAAGGDTSLNLSHPDLLSNWAKQRSDPINIPIRNRANNAGRSGSGSIGRMTSSFNELLQIILDDGPSATDGDEHSMDVDPGGAGLLEWKSNVKSEPISLPVGYADNVAAFAASRSRPRSNASSNNSIGMESEVSVDPSSVAAPFQRKLAAMSFSSIKFPSSASLRKHSSNLNSSSLRKLTPFNLSSASFRTSSFNLSSGALRGLVTPKSPDEVSVSGLSVGSNSSGVSPGTEGKQLFSEAMNQHPNGNVFDPNNSGVHQTAGPVVSAWATPNENSSYKAKRSRSASSNSPALATEKKMQRAGSSLRDIWSADASLPPFYKQVSPAPAMRTYPQSNPTQQHGDQMDTDNGAKRLGRWTKDEQMRLREAIERFGPDPKWRQVAAFVGTRTGPQCSQHWHRNLAPDIAPRRRGAWIPEEDNTLRVLIGQFGSRGPWPPIAEKMRMHGFQRTDKQCRERWQHHLDPSLRLGNFSEKEDQLLMQTYHACGDKWNWKSMKEALPGRTRDQVKRRLKALKKSVSKRRA